MVNRNQIKFKSQLVRANKIRIKSCFPHPTSTVFSRISVKSACPWPLVRFSFVPANFSQHGRRSEYAAIQDASAVLHEAILYSPPPWPLGRQSTAYELQFKTFVKQSGRRRAFATTNSTNEHGKTKVRNIFDKPHIKKKIDEVHERLRGPLRIYKNLTQGQWKKIVTVKKKRNLEL